MVEQDRSDKEGKLIRVILSIKKKKKSSTTAVEEKNQFIYAAL